jgi:hypothetical protein
MTLRATHAAPIILGICLCVLAPPQLRAQGPEDEALAVVHQLFQAMRARDTVALRAVFDSAADLVTTGRDQQGGFTSRRVPVGDFVAIVGRQTTDLDERIHDVEVRVDDGLASVWAPYEFYANGTFSHCGVDAFQLARTAAGWRIVALADTRRRDGCAGGGP